MTRYLPSPSRASLHRFSQRAPDRVEYDVYAMAVGDLREALSNIFRSMVDDIGRADMAAEVERRGRAGRRDHPRFGRSAVQN
ncbi:MAG: hypothetical protein U1E21_25030 [Reyranellaceae bacterium]